SLVSRAASLQCLAGADVGRRFALAEARTELGRGLQVDVRLRDLAVSRHHARIQQHEGTFLLEDQDSPNGVYLNGQRVEAPRPLQDGDVIELGRTLLRFQAPAAEPPTEVPPTERPPEEAPPDAPAAAAGEPPPEPESTPARTRGRWEGGLLALGAGLALVGLLTAYLLAG
ncbi:MAG: FHA domain-containing protein, partial [Cystobacter sp.]